MKLQMSPAEADAAISALMPQIDRYAELLIKKGVALRPGQELVVQAPVECADFARRVVKCAYEQRAGHVTVIWNDDVVTRLEYENVGLPYFEHTPSWKVEQLNSLDGEETDAGGNMPSTNDFAGSSDGGDDKSLLMQCIEIAVEDHQVSTSMLQRRLRVGYARAGRLVDEMEKQGIISAKDGAKPRLCLITRDEYEQMKSAGRFS